jgi:hypothetical protein
MKNLLLFVLLLILSHSYGQRKFERMIDEGHSYLSGTIYQGTIHDGKNTFLKVKRRYFFNKTAKEDANRGLSDYYLLLNDTTTSINFLMKNISKSIIKKIEQNNFEKVSVKKENWNYYYSISRIIELLISKKEKKLASNYFEFFKSKVKVTWTCGIGSMGHSDFIEKTELALK